MPVNVIAVTERRAAESRVAITPESAKGLGKLGASVSIEAGAGQAAHFSDDAYRAEGASVEGDREGLIRRADCWFTVNAPETAELELLKPGGLVIGFLRPFDDPSLVGDLARLGVTSFALELLPRTTRAQAMDALSSQASLAGYRAALLAATHLPKISPMMTTPAGTIPPARVLVIGAGVAGLQAIATAGRLGARVEAYDTRPVVKEQVESLGARFMELDLDVGDSETAGGYAKAQSDDFLARQQQLLAERLPDFDIVITTALVPGQRAPILVPRSAVDAMRPGSVVVDLAAANGGNCEVSEADREVNHGGVCVLGPTNLPAELAPDASRMFSRNLLAFARLLLDEEGELALDFDDEIIAGALLTRDGRIVPDAVRGRMEDSQA